jgi:Mg-chelatase subunit ChlD
VPEFAQPIWLALVAAVPVFIWFRFRAGLLKGRFKRIAGTSVRAILVVVLVVALAGPLKGERSEHTDVVFVLDVSSSIGRQTSSAAVDFINRAFAEKELAARVGLVVFGADAATETVLSEAAEPITEIAADVRRAGSDIGRALEVAMSSFQAGVQRRIVLLSDGQENAGHARAAAAVARSIGVQISTVELQRETSASEVLVRNILVPPWVRVQEPFDIEVTMQSSKTNRAHLVVMRNAVPIGERSITLKAGLNVVTLSEQVTKPGLYEYEAVINSDDDGVNENNRYQAFVQVRGEPRVLHAVGEAGWGRHVTQALRTQGLLVEEVLGTALPTTLHGLSDYDLVVLNNVSGFDVSIAKMELLEDYVRNAGGGVISLGGDKSYSAGGYYGTPVEELLPVTMDIKTEAKIPTLAVTIVMDRSGSMATNGKLVIAKAAAMAAVEVLNPLDQVSVLAFDDAPEWSVPPSEVGNRRAIVDQLRMVTSGGGTDLFLALQEAYAVMVEQQARVKHIIVLSDGLTETGENFNELIARMTKAGITVSTVAFGGDADRSLMERIASLGRGRHYYTDTPSNIPRIFTSETLVVSRNLLVEGNTLPKLVYASEMVDGFGADSFPELSGYQRIFAKPAAQVVLSAGDDDPLLVSWRYGLGRSVAFTSDLAGRWGKKWVEWPELPKFVAQMARWTMRREATERLLPEFRWHGSRGEISVDALDRNDRFINGLDMQANIVDPSSQAQQILLQQVAPGKYRGEFEVPEPGRYYVNLSGTAAGIQVGPKTFGLAVPYSSEYLDLGANRTLLQDIADTTGGETLALSMQSIPNVLSPSADAINHQARIWWPFVLLALLLLILEVMIRKFVLPEPWRLRLMKLINRKRETQAAEPGYDELVANIAALREKHLKALNSGVRYRPEDPAVRARLYLSSNRR